MLSLRFVTTVLLSLFACTSAQQWSISGTATTTPCLDSAEAYLIALRWLYIFQTDSKGAGTGAALVSTSLATNFTYAQVEALNVLHQIYTYRLSSTSYYDEGASFGKPGAVYHNASEVEESVSGSGYSGSLVTSVQYSILSAFQSCDTVSVRWQSDSKSAKSKGV
jgi:hypothetical protein